MGNDFINNIDPFWFRIGFVGIRYYTALFIAVIIGGFFLFLWQAKRGGYSFRSVCVLLLLSVPAVLIGARLGHCLFYSPEYYLLHPHEIIIIWRGGLASHGALVAMIIVLVLFARKYHRPALDVLDRYTFTATFGAALVRLGNYFNSEVVGRETSVSWGVRFIRYDAGSKLRHPTQIYEFAMGILCLVLLVVLDRFLGKERRPIGVLSGVFLCGYFTGRFFIEFTKEFQRPMGISLLTMGQYLSIPPVLVGIYLLVWGLRKNRRASS